MQKSEFINIIRSGKVAPYASYDELNSLADKYPFSSTLQVIKALAARQEDRIDQNESLERAAVYIQDRKKLYAYTIKESIDHKIREYSVENKESDLDTDSDDTYQVSEESQSSKVPTESESSGDIQTAEKDSDDASISSKPLEEQIMREAVMHLSELETEQRLSDLPPAKEEVNPGQVKDTDQVEPKSFGSWLLSLDDQTEASKGSLDKNLIDKFIQESPQVSPVKAAFFSPSQVGKMSLMEDETFVTETLASIYERQGDFKKAARAYKNLKLKYPEKSSYFAALQKKAEDQIKK